MFNVYLLVFKTFFIKKNISTAKILMHLILNVRGLQKTDMNHIHKDLLCDTTSL